MIEDVVLDQDAVFRVGRVVSVDGRRVRIAVDKLKNGSHLLIVAVSYEISLFRAM